MDERNDRNIVNTTVAGSDRELMEGAQAEVPHALMRLERAQGQLHEVVKVLHERLAPVRNERPQKESDAQKKAVRGYGSEVARAIGQQADMTELASQVIIKILNEIEV